MEDLFKSVISLLLSSPQALTSKAEDFMVSVSSTQMSLVPKCYIYRNRNDKKIDLLCTIGAQLHIKATDMY